METELHQLGFHGNARNAQPAGGLGLVAMSQLDGLPEEFPFGGLQQVRMHVGHFAALGRCQQTSHVLGQTLAGGARRARLLVQGRTHMIQIDRITLGQQQCLANGIFQLAHVSRPRMRL